jgi:hypothetical protein
MTNNDQGGKPGHTPDTPLNADKIEVALPSAPRPTNARKHKGKGRFKELSWTVFGGLGPFFVALIIHASTIGWSSAVDPSNLSYSLFALSLAGIVRIVSHGSGRDVLPALYFLGITQMVFALYFGGSFDTTAPPSKWQIQTADKGLVATAPPAPSQTNKVSTLLAIMAEDNHEPSNTAYISLGLTGLISLFMMLRFWSPAISDDNEGGGN